jgi:ABC-type transport system substrate-binding protein
VARGAWLWIVGLGIGAGILASVAAAGLAGRGQQKGGTLRLSSPRLIDTVDPALAYTSQDWELEFATCAELYSYPDKPAPAGAIPIPEVATAFPKVSAGGKTETIQLQRTFRFNTGQPVTAANFVAAFNRDASPELQSPATNYLHEIVGADAVIAGSAQAISGVKALGLYTLQIRTIRPLPDLVSRLTMPFFCPVAVDTPLQEIDTPLGTGPYYVSSYVPDRQVVLDRNPFYVGPRPANVDQILWTVNGLEACRVAVEQDQLDYCAGLGVPATDLPAIAAKYGINRKGGQFFFYPTLTTDFFALNHDRPAFKGAGQIPLAQAINWAIDRPALERAAGYLAGKRTDQILPPAMTRPASLYPLGGVTERSLGRARALMKKAKFRPTKLVLYTDTNDPDPAWAQIFQFNLKRIGIEVDIKYFPYDTYGAIVGTRGAPFDVAIQNWTSDYADPIAFFGPLLDGAHLTQMGNQNVAYFDRPKYNREIESIEGLTGAARRKAWADLDVEMMRDDPPWAPIMTKAASVFVSKSFGCFVFQPVYARPDLAAACKK